MAAKSAYHVYQHLDDPEIIAIWTVDEFVAMTVPLLLGLVFRHVFVGLLLCIACWWGLKKLKAGRSLDWAYGIVYWYASGTIAPMKGSPPSTYRVMVG